MNLKTISLLLLVAALMAAAFLFMRLAGPALGPLFLIEVRVTFAAVVLMLWAFFSRQQLNFQKSWKDWLVLGFFNAAGPFTLIAWAELHITSSLAAILISTIPLFTALLSVVWLKEPLTLKKGIGLVLGLLGVIILSGWSPLEINSVTLLSIITVLVSACFYAVGGIYAKVRFQGISSLSVTVGNFAAAGLLLLPLAAFSVPTTLPSLEVILSLVGLVLLSTVISYLLYFQIIQQHGASVGSSIGYLIPVFGSLYGTTLLHEAFSAEMVFGLIIVLLSVGLVTNLNLRLPSRTRGKHLAEGAD